jgi:hypothetical protein
VCWEKLHFTAEWKGGQMTTWGVQNCQHSNKEEKSQGVDVKRERERCDNPKRSITI